MLRHHLPVSRARHQRGLLQAHVEHAQGRPEHQIGEREIVARQRPDHAAHGVDAQRRFGEPEPGFEQRVDPADVGAEHEDPGHRGEQARDREGEQRKRMEQRPERRVGAFDHECNERTHQQGRHRGSDRKNERIAEQAQDVPARIGIDEVAQRRRARPEAGVLREGGIEQGGERHEHQPARDHNAGDQRQRARTQHVCQHARERAGAVRGVRAGLGETHVMPPCGRRVPQRRRP